MNENLILSLLMSMPPQRRTMFIIEIILADVMANAKAGGADPREKYNQYQQLQNTIFEIVLNDDDRKVHYLTRNHK